MGLKQYKKSTENLIKTKIKIYQYPFFKLQSTRHNPMNRLYWVGETVKSRHAGLLKACYERNIS